MEAEEIAKNIMEMLKAVSDTQSSQTRVIDKLSDGLMHTVFVIDSMKTEIKNLRNRVEALEKEAKE